MEPARFSSFGRFVARLSNGEPECSNWEELFYDLSQRLCRSQMGHWRRLHLLQAVRASTRIEIYHRLERAREFMLDHIGQPLSLDEISRAALLSKYALVRAFKAAYGLSPYRYFLKKKVEYSRQMLRDGMPISEIAHQLGFADHSSFCKCFMKEMGITPSTYREAVK